MNIEIWKDIVGYEGLYQVSNMGNVRSNDRVVYRCFRGTKYSCLRKGRILKPIKNRRGYLHVWLFDRYGNKKRIGIHRLVAKAFCIRQCEEDVCVNHKNEVPSDNRAENLEWCTHKYNSNYGTAIQRRVATVKANRSKCKPIRQFDLQGNLIKEYPSITEMAEETGFKKSTVCISLRGIRGKYDAYGYHWEYAK